MTNRQLQHQRNFSDRLKDEFKYDAPSLDISQMMRDLNNQDKKRTRISSEAHKKIHDLASGRASHHSHHPTHRSANHNNLHQSKPNIFTSPKPEKMDKELKEPVQ